MVQQSQSSAKRNFPYFLVEEGLRKNRAAERFREYLAGKISERAEIEMRYVKLLQDWVNDLAPPREKDDGSEVYMDAEILNKLTNGLKHEATHTIMRRQRVYSCIMSEAGPYARLTRVYKYNDKRTVGEIHQEFAKLQLQRLSTDKEIKRHQDAREHFRQKIQELERQLSNRSRLTSSRRPSSRTGTRKVDDMRNQLSSLRLRNDDVTNKIEILEKELDENVNTTEQPLKDMDHELQEMDDLVMKAIVKQAQLLLSFLKDLVPSKPLEGGEIKVPDDMYAKQWETVHANARRMQLGEQFKLRPCKAFVPRLPGSIITHHTDCQEAVLLIQMLNLENYSLDFKELFEVSSQKNKTSLDGLVTKSLGKSAPASEIRNELSNMRTRMFNVEKRPEDNNDDTGSASTAISESTASPRINPDIRSVSAALSEDQASPRSSNSRYWPRALVQQSDSSYVASECDSFERYSVYEGIRKPPIAPSTVSGGSIEELLLPPEVVCPAELTRLEPNKQFRTRMRISKSRKEDNDVQYITEMCPVSQVKRLSPEHCEVLSSDDESNLAKKRGVRVIAIADNLVAPGSNLLSFKKGQVIKQKVGENEEGLCYGWSRDSMLGRKQYGFYRSSLVKSYSKADESL